MQPKCMLYNTECMPYNMDCIPYDPKCIQYQIPILHATNSNVEFSKYMLRTQKNQKFIFLQNLIQNQSKIQTKSMEHPKHPNAKIQTESMKYSKFN